MERKEITIEDIKAVDAFLAQQPLPSRTPIKIDLTQYIPREMVDKDAELACNLRERQRGTGVYNYDVVWLLEIGKECCSLSLSDIAQVLNALISASEREKPQQP